MKLTLAGRFLLVGLAIILGCAVTTGAENDTSLYDDNNEQCHHFRSYVNNKGDECSCKFRSSSSRCTSDASKKAETYQEKNKKCKFNHGLESYVNDKSNPCECGSRGYAQCTSTTAIAKIVTTDSSPPSVISSDSDPSANIATTTTQKITPLVNKFTVPPRKFQFPSRFQKSNLTQLQVQSAQLQHPATVNPVILPRKLSTTVSTTTISEIGSTTVTVPPTEATEVTEFTTDVSNI